jgi:hypothetical protein
MCYAALVNYFFPLPALDFDTEHWSIESIRSNIKAVPHSTNVEHLKKMLSATQYYLTQPAHQTVMISLKELTAVTKRQLEISKYFSSTKKITELINTPFNEGLAQELSEKIKLKLLYREATADRLIDKINLANVEYNTHQELLFQLNSLFDHCRRAHYQKMEQKNLRQVEHDLDVNYSGETIWSHEKIKSLAISIPYIAIHQLEDLIRAIIPEQSKHNKALLNLTKQIEHFNRVNEVLTDNIHALNKLEKELDGKFASCSLFSLEDHQKFKSHTVNLINI